MELPMTADPGSSARAERRRNRRRQTSLLATVNYARVLLPCFVVDVSRGGARIKLLEAGALPRGPAVLECARLGTLAAELVWQKGLFAGLQFAETLPLPETARQGAAEAPAGAD
jgi:PilZ domain-containing protein